MMTPLPATSIWRCPECGTVYEAALERCGQRQPWECEGIPVPVRESAHERIARAFHEEYEERAPRVGYTTREESAVPWDDVPATNRLLMEGTVAALLRHGIIDLGPALTDPAPFEACGRGICAKHDGHEGPCDY